MRRGRPGAVARMLPPNGPPHLGPNHAVRLDNLLQLLLNEVVVRLDVLANQPAHLRGRGRGRERGRAGRGVGARALPGEGQPLQSLPASRAALRGRPLGPALTARNAGSSFHLSSRVATGLASTEASSSANARAASAARFGSTPSPAGSATAAAAAAAMGPLPPELCSWSTGRRCEFRGAAVTVPRPAVPRPPVACKTRLCRSAGRQLGAAPLWRPGQLWRERPLPYTRSVWYACGDGPLAGRRAEHRSRIGECAGRLPFRPPHTKVEITKGRSHPKEGT